MNSVMQEQAGGQFQARYDLDAHEIQASVAGFLERSSLPPGELIGVVLEPQSDIANTARSLERVTFESIFTSNDADFMQATYAPVEANSRFLAVLDRKRGKVAGTMRIIDKPPFISLEDAPARIGHTKEEICEYHGIKEGDAIWDVATLAIDPDYRSKTVQGMAINAMIYRMFAVKGKQEGVQHIVTMLDAKAYHTLQNIGASATPMHGHEQPFEYLDSPKTLALYSEFGGFAQGVATHYHSYHRSTQQALDLVKYTRFGLRNEIGRTAAKRLGLAKVAGMITTGKHIDQHIALAA